MNDAQQWVLRQLRQERWLAGLHQAAEAEPTVDPADESTADAEAAATLEACRKPA